MRPIDPLSIKSFAYCSGASNRRWNASMRLCGASRSRSAANPRSDSTAPVNGFSRRTRCPIDIKADAVSRWVWVGVTTTVALQTPAAANSSTLENTGICKSSSAAKRPARSRSRSTSAANEHGPPSCASSHRCSACTTPIRPRPTTATFKGSDIVCQLTVSLLSLEGGQSCPQPAFSRLWPPQKAAAAKIGRPPKVSSHLWRHRTQFPATIVRMLAKSSLAELKKKEFE